MNSCLNSLIVRQILPLPASQERITPFYSHSKLLKTHSSSFSIPNLQKSEIYVHMFCPQKWNLSSTSRPNTCFSLYFKLCVGASWTTGVNLSATGSQSLGPALLSCFLTDPHLKSPILRNFYTSREKSKKSECLWGQSPNSWCLSNSEHYLVTSCLSNSEHNLAFPGHSEGPQSVKEQACSLFSSGGWSRLR